MESFSDSYLKQVHQHSLKNQKELAMSKKCACYHCFQYYDPKTIENFLEEKDGQNTALCPRCYTDTLIGDASVLELTDQLLDALADVYLRGHNRDDIKGSDGPEIVILD